MQGFSVFLRGPRMNNSLLILLLVFIVQSRCSSGTFVGVNFGRDVSNLPRPESVCDLLRSMGVNQVKIYDANSAVLTAFAGSGIQVLIGLPNNAIRSVASSSITAATWVKNNVISFLPNTNIRGIVVGNQVLTDYTIAAPILVTAMQYIHQALVDARLHKHIKVSSPHSTNLILGAFPPSHAFFNSTYSDSVIVPLLGFLSQTRSYLMLNMNPWRIYQQTKQVTSLEYVLFLPNKGAMDSTTNLNYTNLFDALVDAAFTSMARLNYTDIPIVISEVGWPWRSPDSGSSDASIQNAAIYNRNLVQHILMNRGTPLRPGIQVDAYIYELFDEDKKVGDGVLPEDRFYGIFNVNQTAIYGLDITGVTLTNNTSNGNSSGMNDGSSSSNNGSWCIAKDKGVDENVMESALDWACGTGNADCSAIQPNGSCYLPNSLISHASYAFNSYYQMNGGSNGSCDFQGCAQVTTSDPSYGNCKYIFGVQRGTSNVSADHSSSATTFTTFVFGCWVRAACVLLMIIMLI